jgi:hypothetical protein
MTPKIKYVIPNRSKLIATRVPNPAKGTPFITHIPAKIGIEIKEINETVTPKIVISLKGLYECAKTPLNARSITKDVCALETPPYRGGLSIGIPIDLKPTQPYRPLTNLFLSVMDLTVK